MTVMGISHDRHTSYRVIQRTLEDHDMAAKTFPHKQAATTPRFSFAGIHVHTLQHGFRTPALLT